MWGGWGSNPRPADYEKPGCPRRTHYQHGYNVVPLMAPTALVAPMARSTSRSTAAAPDSLCPATVRNIAAGMSGASGASGPAECDPEHN